MQHVVSQLITKRAELKGELHHHQKRIEVIFPTMIGAGKEYIGANTGQLIRVSIAEDDDRIITIKGVP